jgi:hypothetical protein
MLPLLLAASAEGGDEEVDARQARDLQLLAEFDVAATPHGALDYLASLVPVGDPNEVADTLIEQLGDDQFERREQAAARLVNLPSLPRGKLELATQSADAEIRWRARVVLGRLTSAGNRALLAALRVVSRDPPAGSLDTLLRLAAFESQEPQQLALHHALAKIASESDVAKLQQASTDGPLYMRLAAAQALQRLKDQQGRDALVQLLQADQPRAVLAAGKYLGNAGDRRALPALSKLLVCDDVAVANDCANFISALVGRDFGYSPYGDAAARQQAAAEMQRWLAAEGQTAELTFPVAEPVIHRGDLAGNTLVTTGTLGRVIELDAKGNEVWQYNAVSWSAEKLPNGNILIASYHANQVLEVNKHGAVVWTRPGLNAMRAKPLVDGHVLVADFQGKQVVELNDSHQEVWRVQTPDNCFDAERLPNGHTVFCCPNLIREVDADGQTVRDLAIEGRANSVQVLANGRWLVANFQKGQVQEYDRAGKIVWSFDEAHPCDAMRLKSGKTLVASDRRAIEVAADGKTTREITETRYGSVRQ